MPGDGLDPLIPLIQEEFTMPQPFATMSLESLIHGGFFRDAGEWIERDLLSNGSPQDGYQKLLYSIYFRQVARLDEAKEILGLGEQGGTVDVNGVFNYVQASLGQGRYTDALRMIDRLALGVNQDSGHAADGVLMHMHSIRSTLQSLTAKRMAPIPSTQGRQPTYRIDTSERREKSPSLVSDNIHPVSICDAVFCPDSHTWADCHSNNLLQQLLQANHDFSGFFGGSRPSLRAVPEALLTRAITIAGPALYIPATLHFGHFLTQCAGFLHPLARMDLALSQDQPITCLLDGCLPEPFKRLIERGSSRPVLFRQLTDQPVRAQQLIVSDCSWLEWHYCNRQHVELFARAAKSYANSSDVRPEPGYGRVYFSRSRVASGLRLSMNELDLERRLEAMGFKIVHPQKLDLSSLIKILDSADILVGSMGSAMHNLLFRTINKPLKVVNLAHFLPPYNFVLIESALGILDNFYLRACEEVRSVGNEPNRLYFDIPSICDRVDGILSI